MDFYEEASLVMVPSGYKDQKVYSSVPDDGSGDLTFSRASTATRVNSDGYIEKAKVNLLLQSNTFSTTWVTTTASVTGGQTGYDGTSDAWLLTKSAASGRIHQNITISNILTGSIYLKANASNWAALQIDGTPDDYIYVDLINGISGYTGSGNIDATITSVGDGWYRVSVTSDSTTRIRIYPADGDGDVSGTSGSIYIQDAQVNYGLVAQDYVETTTASVTEGVAIDVPRLNYDPVNPTSASLLLEPSRTNVLPQSEYYGGSEWTKTNTSVTTNATTSPEGVQNASLVYPTASASTKWGVMLQEFLSVPSGNYTNTFYLKSNGWRWVYLIDASGAKNVWFDLQEGVVGTQEANATGEIQAMGDGWYKCVVTPHTTPTTYTYAGLFFSDADNSYVCTASGTNGVYVYGAQSEAGSYPTSYIPTYGSSATRTADACSKTSATAIIGQTEGTFFAEVDFKDTNADQMYLTLSDGTSNNRIHIGYDASGDFIYCNIRSGGSAQGLLQSAVGPSEGIKKIAVGYKLNDYVLYINGEQIAVDSSALVPACPRLDVGGYFNAGYEYPVNQALLFTSRLSNADLATLTTL